MALILGLSAFYHDSAAALLRDGELIAAAQEERFSRIKHDAGFPSRAVAYCLEAAGCTLADLDYVGFYEKPLAKFDRLLRTYLAFAPRGYASFRQALPRWSSTKLRLAREIDRGLGGVPSNPYVFAEHHESHAASAFYPSPFDEAAILTLDGVGEWSTATFGVGRGARIELTRELRFPHSLGLLYSAFTYYTGFKVDSAEYKVMGLAPYGEPRFADVIRKHLIDVREDGSFRMDMQYFNYCEGLTMTSRRFDDLFGGPPRDPDAPLSQREMDLAASVQAVTDDIMLRCGQHVRKATGQRNLVMAGGVGLNCVSTGKLLRAGVFDDVWIQPAAGDAGGAVGVVWLVWHQLLKRPRSARPGGAQHGSLLGPEYSDTRIRDFLAGIGAPYTYFGDHPDDLSRAVATALARGEVVGWFQGRMEFGPRALGSRSILGDPRHPEMQSRINRKIKYREGFRPFAPAVLESRCREYFDHDGPSPYMTFVVPVAERQMLAEAADGSVTGIARLPIPRSTLPAVTHVDGTARIQTVGSEANPRFLALLEEFHRQTGCPVLVNTSFNVRGEPIVCTPEHAFAGFLRTDMDRLALGSFLLDRSAKRALGLGVPGTLAADWSRSDTDRNTGHYSLDD